MAIKLLFTPSFPSIEYRLPGFPPDPYGFTLEDRLKWSRISIDYIRNSEDISFLSEQRLPGGEPLYNDRELGHMEDVKVLFHLANRVWWILGIGYLTLLFFTWKYDHLDRFAVFLVRGSWLTIGLIISILIGVIVSFNDLFTQFHRIFFEGDTWLFFYSDSLIRLFPMRFWQDGFIALGVISLFGSIILLKIGKYIKRSNIVWLQKTRG
jgi:integral membrane protein (TIGR01906 family)